MPIRRRCPICRSKQWHKEPSSGVITCSEGHVLQDYRNETNERTEFGPHVMKKRTVKSGRKKKEKESKANPTLYHGDRARYHYFQCLQLLLRMQVKTLAELWKLSPEFEAVTKDIWALHLDLLLDPLPAEPFYFPQRQEKNPSNKSKEDKPLTGDGPDAEPMESSEDGAGNDVRSENSLSAEDDERDPVMADLLRQNSETESSADEGERQQPAAKPVVAAQKKKWRRDESPAGNMAVLILACYTMRLPVMYMDLITLIEMYTLPYLDPVRLLPESLTRHLTKHMIQALSPHHPPSTIALHAMVSRLAKSVSSVNGIFTPDVNAAPMLWRAVRHLGGNPVLYKLTKLFARLLELPLSLHPALAPTLTREGKQVPTTYKNDNLPPEVSLIASVLIALKLIYGLDGKKRLPRQDWDPACAMPSLESYLAHIRGMNESDSSMQRTLFEASSDIPVLDYDNNQLDLYLGFCERALLTSRDNRSNDLVDEYFPLEKHRDASDSRKERGVNNQDDAVQRSVYLQAQGLAPEGCSTIKPGESYLIYSSQDILGSLAEEFEVVVDRAARWAGVSGDDVCEVIERYERRILRWEKASEREREIGQYS